MLSGDLVAAWEVALSDGVYRIEFAHGTTSGKRVVCVNGQVRRIAGDELRGSIPYFRKTNMFNLFYFSKSRNTAV